MATIKINPQEIRSMEAKMTSCNNLMDSITKNTLSAINHINVGVNNSAANNMKSKMDALKLVVLDLKCYFELHSDVLRSIADKFEEAEHAIISDQEAACEVPLIAQTTNYTCGAVCGEMILKYFGIDVTEMGFADEAGSTPESGTYVYKLTNAINNHLDENNRYQYGYLANTPRDEVYELLKNSLNNNHPVIVNVSYGGNTEFTGATFGGHYIVVTKVFYASDGSKMVTVNNPGAGGETVDLPFDHLMDYFDNGNGYMIY
nr:C39 family peptidase [uncultured Ruminococcus sp.]